MIIILSAFALCGCENRESVLAETSAGITETAAVSTVHEISETVSGRSAVTFAPADTETKKTKPTVSETTEAEEIPAEIQLAENQLDYKGKNFYLLMEFNGVESMKYYSKSSTDKRYVLHSKFTVTNISKKSFVFFPRKMIIYGRHSENRGSMSAMDASKAGLAALDDSYTIEAGETISINVDFIGDEVCVDYANEIYYNSEDPFRLTKRSAVKSAVRAARDKQAEKTKVPEALVPRDGEYSVLTHKNSYCFTAEPVADGRYIKIALRIQCLTGKPETFNPRKFKLYSKSGDHEYAYRWSFDPFLVKMFSNKGVENDLEGISETLYDTPWELYVRPDGSAEYTMYFLHPYDTDASEYDKFCYEGENGDDVFECIINME